MTPREFVKNYSYDERLVTGDYYPTDPLTVEKGDRVGVVLLNLGGPDQSDDVAPFLYNLFMDPAIIDLPVRGRFRHWMSKLISSLRARSVGEDYEVIGGGSPINRLTREQANSLEKMLNERFGEVYGVNFHTYIAMRYWHPFSEEAARQMQEDGIDKVVLLPLYPQYSKTTTGSSLLYWKMLEDQGEIPSWPTTEIVEYAANPKLIRAFSERIDEALQRFPKAVRDDVHILFSAHGTPLKEMEERRDPYCCLAHGTADRIMALREHDLPYHVAFQSKVGFAEWLTPSTPDTLEHLADVGHKAVLVVPVAFVTDHIETAYELDIEIREEAEEFGIEHYEVTSGLNCHPLFIKALAEATIAQLRPQGTSVEQVLSANGVPARDEYTLRPLNQLPHFDSSERLTRCHQCQYITEPCRWKNDKDAAHTSSADVSNEA